MNSKEIGQIIKKGRTRKEITQDDLAKMLGKTKATVSKWEHGIAMPPSDILMEIVTKLDIVADLFPNHAKTSAFVKHEEMQKFREELREEISEIRQLIGK